MHCVSTRLNQCSGVKLRLSSPRLHLTASRQRTVKGRPLCSHTAVCGSGAFAHAARVLPTTKEAQAAPISPSAALPRAELLLPQRLLPSASKSSQSGTKAEPPQVGARFELKVYTGAAWRAFLSGALRSSGKERGGRRMHRRRRGSSRMAPSG